MSRFLTSHLCKPEHSCGAPNIIEWKCAAVPLHRSPLLAPSCLLTTTLAHIKEKHDCRHCRQHVPYNYPGIRTLYCVLTSDGAYVHGADQGFRAPQNSSAAGIGNGKALACTNYAQLKRQITLRMHPWS